MALGHSGSGGGISIGINAVCPDEWYKLLLYRYRPKSSKGNVVGVPLSKYSGVLFLGGGAALQ